MCDSPDEFSNCGEGVTLYFSFFKFCIIVIFIATIGISFIDSYISYYYYSKLKIFCVDLPILVGHYINYEDCLYDYNHAIYFCEIYSEEKRLSSDLRLRLNPELHMHLSKGWGLLTHEPYTTLYDSFFFKTSLVNYNNYIYCIFNLYFLYV